MTTLKWSYIVHMGRFVRFFYKYTKKAREKYRSGDIEIIKKKETSIII